MKKLILLIVVSCVISCGKKKEQDFYSPKNNTFKDSYARGEAVYQDLCITCHLTDGKGVPKAFPPLAGSDYLENNQDNSIRAVKYGMSGEIVVNGVTYNTVMASMGLSDEEVADVMNYINKSWDNDFGEIITAQKVTKITP